MKISVIVCTRHRAEYVRACIATVLQNDHTDFECVVIDQSLDDDTEALMAAFLSDSRVRYLRSQSVGVSRSRNLGLQIVDAPIVVYADDDCTFSTDWLSSIDRIFQRNPTAMAVYTNVLPGPAEGLGFIPQFHAKNEKLTSKLGATFPLRGIGAGLSMRRGPVSQIGGFDEQLGPGGKFKSGEDVDLTLRLLMAGLGVLETNATSVVHHGFRRMDELPALTERDFFAVGAVCAKLCKCRHRYAWLLVASIVWGWCLAEPLGQLARFRKPRGLRRLLHLARGMRAGLQSVLDPETLLYVPDAT